MAPSAQQDPSLALSPAPCHIWVEGVVSGDQCPTLLDSDRQGWKNGRCPGNRLAPTPKMLGVGWEVQGPSEGCGDEGRRKKQAQSSAGLLRSQHLLVPPYPILPQRPSRAPSPPTLIPRVQIPFPRKESHQAIWREEQPDFSGTVQSCVQQAITT